MRNITFSILILSLIACKNEQISEDLDFIIISKIMDQYNLHDSSTIFIRNRQGVFSYDSTGTDTINLIYSGLVFLQNDTKENDLSKQLNNLYYFKDSPGLLETTNYWDYDFINNIHIVDINKLKKYFLKDSVNKTKHYIINWSDLKNIGKFKICSFSELIYNPIENYGFCAFQIFQENDFEIKILYFTERGSLSIKELGRDNFKVLDYSCRFKNDSLRHFEPNSMIVK